MNLLRVPFRDSNYYPRAQEPAESILGLPGPEDSGPWVYINPATIEVLFPGPEGGTVICTSRCSVDTPLSQDAVALGLRNL